MSMSKAFEKNIVTTNKMRTICEVLREIYWHTTDPVVREKISEASNMAKRMDKKLHEYKYAWDEGVYEPTENYEEVAAQRREQYEREKDRIDVRKG